MNETTVTTVKAAIAAAVATMTALWGWFGWLVIAWVLLMLADWLIGSAAAAKEGRWSSAKMREGAWHKGGMILVVCIALVAGLYAWKRSMLLSIGGGTAAYMLVLYFL